MATVSVLLLMILFYGVFYSSLSLLHISSGLGKSSQKLRHQSPKQKSYALDLYLFLRTRRFLQRHQFIPNQALLNHRHGSTFQTINIRSTTLYTIEPRNAQVILASDFQNWGLEPTKLPAIGSFCGRGFLTTDGERWAKTRAIVTPFFRRAASIDLTKLDSILKDALQQVPSDEATIDLQPILFDMYFKASYFWFVGEPIESYPGDEPIDVPSLRKAFNQGLDGAQRGHSTGLFRYFGYDAQWEKACDVANQFADKLISNSLGQCSGHPVDGTNSHPPPTLLNAFVQKFDNRVDLRNEVLQFFMSAPQTVPSLLTFACIALSRHPKVWRKLRTEVLGHDCCSLNCDTVKDMPYMRKVINEVLRLHPSNTMLIRTALTDTILPKGGGPDGESSIYVPKGTEVRINVLALHRVASVFGPDPEVFWPERWDTIRPKVWEYIPFGRGPRACLGKEKGLTEMQYALTKLVREFKDIRCAPREEDQMTATDGTPDRCNVVLVRA